MNLDSASEDIKKETADTLADICEYSTAGHRIVLEALEHYQREKAEGFKLSVLFRMLSTSRSDLKISAMTLINDIVENEEELEGRYKMRLELFWDLGFKDFRTVRNNEHFPVSLFSNDVWNRRFTLTKWKIKRVRNF